MSDTGLVNAFSLVTTTADDSIDAVIDRSALLRCFENDAELLREVAALFLEDCPRRLAVLRAALANGDAAQLAYAAHSLKGSMINFAATNATAAAFRVEQLATIGDWRDAAEACASLEREIGRLERVLRLIESRTISVAPQRPTSPG